jgi:hypothetical protein
VTSAEHGSAIAASEACRTPSPLVPKHDGRDIDLTTEFCELMLQSMMGNGSFKLQNPGADENAARLAGMESALRAYEAMLKQKPAFKTAAFDELLARRESGDLAKVAVCGNAR